MVKQWQRPYAKRQRQNSNQLQRRLANAARIQKDKHSKYRQHWWHARKSYNQKSHRNNIFNYQTDSLLYEVRPDQGGSRSRHRQNSKFKHKRTTSKPVVTFREKFARRNSENTFNHDGSSDNGFKFDLKDGRLDVPKVLNNLGVTNLQYEHEPGVWRVLTRLSSGKSINKFQNKQEVYFRADAGNTASGGATKDYTWADSWLVEGDTEEAYNARVSRIVQKTGKGRIGVGTMVRVDTPLIPGLMLTCRHCVELSENGDINEKLLAFGGPVTVLYVSNKYDLALCEGPPGPDGFRLATQGEEVKGREIRMLSYPWHVDLIYGLLEDVGPTQVHGNVCMFSPEGCEMPMEVDALGTYMGGFPASSGGAVTLSSKVLCGIHVGVIWHDKDELSMPLVVGSKGHVEPHKNAFHMQLCTKQRTMDDENSGTTSTRNRGVPQTPERDYCSSSHGYLATYVSSSHIEEVFQDYIENIRMLDSTSERC